VSETGYEPAGLPYRFEPGTPHIIGAASVLAAGRYIESIGYKTIEEYEHSLVEYALAKIRELPKSVKLVGPMDATFRLGVFSFAFEEHHPRDIADALADKDICVRAGHHCTEPLHNHFDLPATLRMSLYIYNTKEDLDRFFAQLQKILLENAL
jgi:cysteine desulfurase/selenocysteine lyase